MIRLKTARLLICHAVEPVGSRSYLVVLALVDKAPDRLADALVKGLLP
jgi:hypothetical protein